MKRVLVIYGSTRRNGNSECLTSSIMKGVPHVPIFLMDCEIQTFSDKRHMDNGFLPTDDEYENRILPLLLDHDIILFSTPLYWYGMSSLFKRFFERWSQYLRDPRFNYLKGLNGKKAYVVVTGGDDPKKKGMPLIEQFQYICDFVGIELVDYIIGSGNKPGEIMSDKEACSKAKEIQLRIKKEMK